MDRRRISATVLLFGGTEQAQQEQNDVRKLVFERLNTGGQQLNSQELRNCLYVGTFNDRLTKTMSADPIFTEIWEIPKHEENMDEGGNPSEALRKNSLYRRMLDCELVLRFFAFRKPSSIKGSVQSMLDNCMEEHKATTEEDLDKMGKDFSERLKLARDIFGAKVFRVPDKRAKYQLSQPLYDGIMIALDRLWDKKKELITAKSAVSKNVEQLFKDERVFEVIVGKPNTAVAVRERMDMLTKAMRDAIQS